MNFGDFLDNNSCGGGSSRFTANLPYSNNNNTIITTPISNMPTGPIAQPRLVSQPMFNSPGLSLALQTGQGEAARMGENYESSITIGGIRRSREDLEHESRSGSDNMDGASGDDIQDGDGDDDNKPPRKKRYHRHTPQQIQELET